MSEVTADFVARDQPHGGWALVLVEEGPWPPGAVDDNLRRVQDRLYGCLDAALDGQVADRFPDSVGRPLVIRLEAIDVPQTALADFYERFKSTVPTLPDYAQAIRDCKHYPSIGFEITMSDLPHAV